MSAINKGRYILLKAIKITQKRAVKKSFLYGLAYVTRRLKIETLTFDFSDIGQRYLFGCLMVYVCRLIIDVFSSFYVFRKIL